MKRKCFQDFRCTLFIYVYSMYFYAVLLYFIYANSVFVSLSSTFRHIYVFACACDSVFVCTCVCLYCATIRIVVTYKRTPTVGPVRPPVAIANQRPPPDAAAGAASANGPVRRQHESHDGHNAPMTEPVPGGSYSANMSHESSAPHTDNSASLLCK